MASYRNRDRRRNKPWLARRKRAGIEYVIGYFPTKEQAEEAELGFDSVWPRPTNKGKRMMVTANGGRCFV